jgi:hypothetical protein
MSAEIKLFHLVIFSNVSTFTSIGNRTFLFNDCVRERMFGRHLKNFGFIIAEEQTPIVNDI